MGFSRGGQAALYASLRRFHQTWNASAIDFTAYIPFYPDCMTTYLSEMDVADRPIRLFHGSPDDYDPVAPCKAYVERLRGAGHDVQLTEYPNAPHGFDSPLGSPTPTIAESAQTVRHYTIREESTGRLINAATKLPFTYKDACVELNPHVGADTPAAHAATESVKSFLKTVFNLNRQKPANIVVEPTPKSLRSCLAPAIGRGSPRAFCAAADTRLLKARSTNNRLASAPVTSTAWVLSMKPQYFFIYPADASSVLGEEWRRMMSSFNFASTAPQATFVCSLAPLA